MPAVFVHGVPDTYRVWNRVIRHLSRTDVIALALPGFDSAIPAGFAATKEEYVDWLVGELERQPGQVDLVGHDWGCLLAVRVASLRPDLVRTWAAGGGPIDRDYQWHELAKVFQTPGAGEEWMAQFRPEQFSGQLASRGVPSELAAETAAHMDDRMKSCILRLYRSAVDAGSEWQPGLAGVQSPGLVLWGNLDQACPVKFADRLGQHTKARRVRKFDSKHWFQLEKPVEMAQALEEHWAATDSK